MRKLIWLSAVTILGGMLMGCSGGDKPAAEDDQFQKDLAAAAAKNPEKGPSKKSAGTKMPGAPSKPDSAAGSGPTVK